MYMYTASFLIVLISLGWKFWSNPCNVLLNYSKRSYLVYSFVVVNRHAVRELTKSRCVAKEENY